MTRLSKLITASHTLDEATEEGLVLQVSVYTGVSMSTKSWYAQGVLRTVGLEVLLGGSDELDGSKLEAGFGQYGFCLNVRFWARQVPVWVLTLGSRSGR